MRLALLGLVTATGLGLLAEAGPVSLADRSRATGNICCDIWVFEPGGGGHEAYALRPRRDGGPVVAMAAADGRMTLIEGAQARAILRRWIATSHRHDASSVYIDARNSQFHVGGPEDELPDEDPEVDDEDMLVVIENASVAQSLTFTAEIAGLSDLDRATMRSYVSGR